jgi:2-methylcitrate dehydratase PrpD
VVAFRDKRGAWCSTHEVDTAYPATLDRQGAPCTTTGRPPAGTARVDEPKGDPGNTLTREEITAKALRLAAFSGGATAVEMQAAVDALWGVADWPRVGALLPPAA